MVLRTTYLPESSRFFSLHGQWQRGGSKGARERRTDKSRIRSFFFPVPVASPSLFYYFLFPKIVASSFWGLRLLTGGWVRWRGELDQADRDSVFFFLFDRVYSSKTESGPAMLGAWLLDWGWQWSCSGASDWGGIPRAQSEMVLGGATTAAGCNRLGVDYGKEGSAQFSYEVEEDRTFLTWKYSSEEEKLALLIVSISVILCRTWEF